MTEVDASERRAGCVAHVQPPGGAALAAAYPGLPSGTPAGVLVSASLLSPPIAVRRRGGTALNITSPRGKSGGAMPLLLACLRTVKDRSFAMT